MSKGSQSSDISSENENRNVFGGEKHPISGKYHVMCRKSFPCDRVKVIVLLRHTKSGQNRLTKAQRESK